MLRLVRTQSVKRIIKNGPKPHEVAEAEEKEIVERYPKWGDIKSENTVLE